MKNITVNGEEYTLKYSMRATMHNDCVKQITKILIESDADEGDANGLSDMIADVIPTVKDCFYAGLIEFHGTHKNGDGRIKGREDSDELLFNLIMENEDNSESEYSDFFGVLGALIDCMGDDGFFRLIGLERMFKQTEEEKPTQKPKRGRKPKNPTTEVGEK